MAVVSEGCEALGIILEGNSVSSSVYSLGGAINKKFYHATRCNPHYLLEQPHKYILLLFRPHQVRRFDSECLIEHNKWAHLFFISIERGLIGAGCRSQFSGEHIGANE